MQPIKITSLTRTTTIVIVLALWESFVLTQVAASNATSDEWGPWSDWSPCSNTCDLELSQRSRSCKLSSNLTGSTPEKARLCKGSEKQYKVCNKQNCIGSSRDYRKEACERQSRVPFRGRRYHWDTYINPRDQCQVTCKARGYGFTIGLGKPVQNGVPCDGKYKDRVCLYGRCQTVGCDGVIGSSARKDHCGVCGGDNDSCRIIAGIFTRRKLKYGYNPITKIPRGSCHINITELAQSRNYLVLKYSNGTGVINHDRSSSSTMQRPGNYYAAGTTFRYGKAAGPHCPGECLYADGPLTDQIDIELLSYSKNKGINYMFTIPKSMIESVMRTFQVRGPTRHQGRHRSTSYRNQTSAATSSRSSQRRITYSEQPEYISPEKRGRDAYGYQALQGKERKIGTQEAINRFREGYNKDLGDSQAINRIDSNSYGSVPLKSRTNTAQQGSRTSNEYNRRINDIPETSRSTQQYNRGRTTTRRGSQTYNRQYPANGNNPAYNVGGDASRTSPARRNQVYNRQYHQAGNQYNSYNNRNIVTNQRQELIVPDTIDEVNFHWTISGFTECSRSCGGGRQDTIMTCMKRKTNVQVTDENCNPAKKKIQTIVCNKSPCPPGWEEGPWSLCSASCGQGIQTRRVECKHRYSENVSIPVSASRCDLSNRPVTTQSCQSKPCAEWKSGNWTRCSVECGIGDMTRSVECVDSEGNKAAETRCPRIKPLTSKRCDMGTCAKGWFQTTWSESCSTECGRGYHTRTVYCSAEDGSPLPESKCGEKPRITKPCKKTRPCGGFWFEGPWSKCLAKCGSEMQTRDVVCMKKLDSDLFAVVGAENCKEYPKPESERPCPALPDCPPEWYMTKWSECSKSCGTGIKTRDVKCLSTDRLPSSGCPVQNKPPLRRTCNTQECDLPQLDEDPSCKDHWKQCRLVVQARLCPYKYYKEKCCQACTLHHLKHKQERQAHQHRSS